MQEEFGNEIFWQTLRSWKFWKREKSMLGQSKESNHAENGDKIIFPIADGTVELSGGD